MKKSIKYIIKLFFVIIVPVVVFLFIMDLSPKQYEITNLFGIVLLTTIAFSNALMCILLMPKTKLIPGTNIKFTPVIGFAIGYDKTGMIPAIVVIIPFLMVEFQLKK